MSLEYTAATSVGWAPPWCQHYWSFRPEMWRRQSDGDQGDSEGLVKLNTSLVERLNLTIRQGSAYPGRRTIGCAPLEGTHNQALDRSAGAHIGFGTCRS